LPIFINIAENAGVAKPRRGYETLAGFPLTFESKLIYAQPMSQIIPFPRAKNRWPPPRPLQPLTARDRIANGLWLIIGFPISVRLFALQVAGVFGWRMF